MILELSSTKRLSAWLKLEPTLENLSVKELEYVTTNLRESLACARERVTLMVVEEIQAMATLPDSLHRATLMIAAKLFRRDESIYGERYVVGGVGEFATVVNNDPDIRELLAPYVRAHVGSAVPTVPLPGTTGRVRDLESMFGLIYPGRGGQLV